MEINISNIAEIVKALNEERLKKDWYILTPKDVLRKNLRRYFGLSSYEIKKFFKAIEDNGKKA